jgi:hypothetical protein
LQFAILKISISRRMLFADVSIGGAGAAALFPMSFGLRGSEPPMKDSAPE